MLKRKLGIGLLLAVALSLFASQAFAGVVYFDVVVPRLGGSANTNTTTKTYIQQEWAVSSLAVGNGYTMYFRPYNGSTGAAGNSYSGTTGSVIIAPYTSTQPIGSLMYLKITNKVTTTVNVEVSGTFNAN